MHVTSTDGTAIGFTRSGEGPPLVLVHGTTGAHWSFRYLEPELVERFTMYALDRRGRGESGDGERYSLELEFDDLAAVVDSLDRPAAVFGHSSGGTVALGAALRSRNVERLILYEASPGLDVVPEEELERVEDLLARGEPDEALVDALGVFGLTPAEIEHLRAAPTWPARVAAAHTVAREVRAEAAYAVDAEQLRALDVPVLLLLGGESPPWAQEATELLRAALPDARVVVLPGQGHAATVTAPEFLAGEIARFLSA